MAAYFGALAAGLERPSALGTVASLLALRWDVAVAPASRVRAGVYCCYDAFSRLDVRCELAVPGGMHTYAVRHRPSPPYAVP